MNKIKNNMIKINVLQFTELYRKYRGTKANSLFYDFENNVKKIPQNCSS